MKEIMKALCGLWKEEWQGMVMGQLNYEKGEGACGGPYFVSASGRRILKVSAFGGNERMEILLFPFSHGEGKEKTGEKGRLWRTFSEGEVHAFSLSMGDHNGIHQARRPVVSGFQLAEALAEGRDFHTLRIRFHHPLYAGEAVYLKEEGKTFWGISEVLCFEAVIG